jgi:hypothetical protein
MARRRRGQPGHDRNPVRRLLRPAPESQWTARAAPADQHGRETAADFSGLCAERALEAGTSGNPVARNGAVLEQSQIVITHNLATLADGLDLIDQLRERAPELARQTLVWVARRLSQRTTSRHAALIQVKNAAYAWRQAIFWLSCDTAEQVSQVRRLGDEILTEDIGPQFRPAVDGLAHVISGERFSAAGTGLESWITALRGLASANAGTGQRAFNARAGGLLLIGSPTSANLGRVMAFASKRRRRSRDRRGHPGTVRRSSARCPAAMTPAAPPTCRGQVTTE